MTKLALWSEYPERLVLTLLLVPQLLLAQEAERTPPPRQVQNAQAFAPNVSTTEGTSAEVTDPNSFSPWFDVVDDARLPDNFDPAEAAAAAATGPAEAAAYAMTNPDPNQDTNVPLSDLPIEDSGGAFLAYPTGVAFAADSLLLTPGGGGFNVLSKEAALPYGDSSYALEFSPRAIPVFRRDQKLTQIGPFRVGVDLKASAAYNNNIFGDTTNAQGDQIYTFSPIVYLEAGTKGRIYLLYAPIWVDFAKYKELSTVNQALFFQLRYPFTKLKLGIDASYLTQSGLFVTGDSGYTTQTTTLVRLFGEYPIARKTILSFSAESVNQQTSPGGTQMTNSAKVGLLYQISTPLKVGVTLKGGQLYTPAEPQTFEAVELVAGYSPSVAWRFAAAAGMEYRHLSLTSNGPEEIPTTIFNFQVDYNPTSTALFSLMFYRNVLNTTFTNVSLNITTGISTSVLLRLWDKVNVRMEMSVGYTEQISDQTGNGGSFYFVQGGITASYPLLNTLEIQIFDNIQQRFNSMVGNNYISNTMGMALSWKF
ncbi:hypothetical protein BH09VER1_BH09VER1_52560 [soil metagenome]